MTVEDTSQRPSWPSGGHSILDITLLEILVLLDTVAINVGIACDGSQHRLEEFKFDG